MGWTVFRQGISVTFRHLGGAVKASVLPLSAGVTGHIALLRLLAPSPSESMPDEVILLSTTEGLTLLAVLLIWWLAILSTVALGWFRSLAAQPLGWVPAAPYGPIFKILNRLTLITLICLVILIVAGYPIRALTAPMVLNGAAWVAMLVFVFLVVLMIYATLRLGLGLPAAAKGERVGLIASASRTRPRSDPLILTALLVAVFWCLAPALGLVLPWLDPVGLVLQLTILWLGYLVLLSILHHLLTESA